MVFCLIISCRWQDSKIDFDIPECVQLSDFTCAKCFWWHSSPIQKMRRRVIPCPFPCYFCRHLVFYVDYISYFQLNRKHPLTSGFFYCWILGASAKESPNTSGTELASYWGIISQCYKNFTPLCKLRLWLWFLLFHVFLWTWRALLVLQRSALLWFKKQSPTICRGIKVLSLLSHSIPFTWACRLSFSCSREISLCWAFSISAVAIFSSISTPTFNTINKYLMSLEKSGVSQKSCF